MNEELSTIFEKPGEIVQEEVQDVQDEGEQQDVEEWGGEEWGGEDNFIRSRSPNRFDSLSYSEKEYESDDLNDEDYIPCYYRFCDEPSEYTCDGCESDLCVDHTYIKYDSENHYCTFCLTNLFNDRLNDVKNNVKKMGKIVKGLNKTAKDTDSDISCIYFSSLVGAVAFIAYNLYIVYAPHLV